MKQTTPAWLLTESSWTSERSIYLLLQYLSAMSGQSWKNMWWARAGLLLACPTASPLPNQGCSISGLVARCVLLKSSPSQRILHFGDFLKILAKLEVRHYSFSVLTEDNVYTQIMNHIVQMCHIAVRHFLDPFFWSFFVFCWLMVFIPCMHQWGRLRPLWPWDSSAFNKSYSTHWDYTRKIY